jgi:hypothetical protein
MFYENISVKKYRHKDFAQICDFKGKYLKTIVDRLFFMAYNK